MTDKKRLETFLPAFGRFYQSHWEQLLSDCEELYATMHADFVEVFPRSVAATRSAPTSRGASANASMLLFLAVRCLVTVAAIAEHLDNMTDGRSLLPDCVGKVACWVAAVAFEAVVSAPRLGAGAVGIPIVVPCTWMLRALTTSLRSARFIRPNQPSPTPS
jgi:hypothetical protein